MTDIYESEDVDHTCAICGRHLNSTNRSTLQPELCKECAGEQSDIAMDDFK